MATLHALATAATPVERILSRLDRKQLAYLIATSISLLDAANDPDMEDDDADLEHDGCEPDDGH